MGLHTWHFKNAEDYGKMVALYNKIDRADNDIEYLDEADYRRINSEADKLHDSNEADYHDTFRTSKRQPDGSYTEDVIRSREQCFKWLEDNKDKVFKDENTDKLLNKFWDEYPNGIISFG